MKILIVGGTSSISQHLIPLLNKVATVTTAGRRNCDHFIDLCDIKSPIKLPENIDVVIHTAAHFGGNSLEDMGTTLTVNVLGTLKLCEAVHLSGVKHFILISSIFSHLEISSSFYSIYSLSKKQSEEVAKFYCKQKSVPLTILRPSQIYGSEFTFEKHHPFFYSIIDKVEKGDPVIFYGSHDALRNFIHIEDLSRIIYKCITNTVIGEFDCAYPKNVSYSEIANAAIAAFKSKSEIQFMKDRSNIEDNVFQFNEALYQVLRLTPEISIQEGMVKIAKHRSSEGVNHSAK